MRRIALAAAGLAAVALIAVSCGSTVRPGGGESSSGDFEPIHDPIGNGGSDIDAMPDGHIQAIDEDDETLDPVALSEEWEDDLLRVYSHLDACTVGPVAAAVQWGAPERAARSSDRERGMVAAAHAARWRAMASTPVPGAEDAVAKIAEVELARAEAWRAANFEEADLPAADDIDLGDAEAEWAEAIDEVCGEGEPGRSSPPGNWQGYATALPLSDPWDPLGGCTLGAVHDALVAEVLTGDPDWGLLPLLEGYARSQIAQWHGPGTSTVGDWADVVDAHVHHDAGSGDVDAVRAEARSWAAGITGCVR